MAVVIRDSITDLAERRRAQEQFCGALVFNTFAGEPTHTQKLRTAIGTEHFLTAAWRRLLDADEAAQRVAEIGSGLVGAFASAAEGGASPFAAKIVDAISTLAQRWGLSAD